MGLRRIRMEISPKMAMSEVDKPRVCPYCRNDIHTFYSDGRCKCTYCEREFYVLKYIEENEDGKID
jgi:ribosomal protein L37AE/L43A